MATEPIGYIVLHGDGMDKTPRELCVGAYYPKDGVLLQGDAVTVFPTRGRARSAVERTIRWGNAEKPLDWAQKHKYKIVRALPPPAA